MPKSRPETKHTSEPLPCKPGDVNGFDELVRQHQGWVRGYFRARINDWTAADDLAREAFITAFQKLSSYKGEASFESWLRGIALNHFRNYIRKHREQYIGGSEELQSVFNNLTLLIGHHESLDSRHFPVLALSPRRVYPHSHEIPMLSPRPRRADHDSNPRRPKTTQHHPHHV